MQLFGKYVGTDRNTGLRWANPLYNKIKVSLRVRNFESAQLKVNDKNGNPIDIAAVVVSNLMVVVLCGDQNTQPVINAGSLYN